MARTMAPPARERWLTRNVIAIGLLSLFSDMGHELTTAVLPLFLATFGGGAMALGVIEGVSDAASSLLKLWMSHYSDRVGKRKPILVVGYLVTAMMGAFVGLAAAMSAVLLGSLIGAVVGIGAVVVARKKFSEFELPFGTFLGLAGLVVALVGPWWLKP